MNNPANPNANENEIQEMTLIIEDSLQAGPYSFEHSFFQDQLKDGIKLLNKLVKRNEKRTEKGRDDKKEGKPFNYHYHETISIFGRRGIGKTSFMLSLQQYVQDHHIELSNKLHFLPLIEPSMLEETEYFLATLTSMICKEVQDTIRNAGHMENTQTPWHKSVKELAEHFVALDEQAYRQHMAQAFQSAEVFGSFTLMQGRSGKLLTEKFHEFVDKSIRTMRDAGKGGLQSLVIMLDDIDTAFDKGWAVLETIRKYLGSPQLIVITSGDTELYDLVIRNQMLEKAKNLTLASSDSGIPEKDANRIYEVEWQYQLKLFPMHNRILLLPAYESLVENGKAEKAKVEKAKGTTGYPMGDLFAAFAVQVLKFPEGSPAMKLHAKNPYTSLIPASNRELIQILDRIMLPAYEHLEFQRTMDLGNVFQSLVELYQTALSADGFNLKSLKATNSALETYVFLKLIRRLMKGERTYQDFYNFQPIYPLYSSENKIVLALNVLFTQTYEKMPERIVDFWTKFSCIYLDYTVEFENNQAGMEEYLAHLHFDAADQAPDICARRISWRHQMTGHPASIGSRKGPGFMKVIKSGSHRWSILGNFEWYDTGLANWIEKAKSARGRRAISRKTISRLVPLWSDFMEKADDITNSILKNYCFITTDKAGSHAYIDFFKGLASMGEVIKAFASADDAVKQEAVTLELKRYQQTRLYPAKRLQDEIGEDIEEVESYWLEQQSNEVPEELVEATMTWLKGLDKLEPIPLTTLSAIWRRTYFNLVAQHGETPLYAISAGELLRGAALVFLNAILVEQLLINPDVPKAEIDLRNLQHSTNIISNNIGLASRIEGFSGSMFGFWLRCPFINSLLECDDEGLANTYTDMREADSDWHPFTYNVAWNMTKKKTLTWEGTAYELLCALQPMPTTKYVIDGKPEKKWAVDQLLSEIAPEVLDKEQES